jgi:hypothetical protein
MPALTVAQLFAAKQAEAARKRAEAEAAAAAAHAEHAAFAEKVMAYRITEEDKARAMSRIAKAFAAGERELLLAQFPAELCLDGGRRVNNRLEGWQDTLPGAFHDVFLWWQAELEPGGFGFGARVLDYPGGMPGNVGIFITWPEVLDR